MRRSREERAWLLSVVSSSELTPGSFRNPSGEAIVVSSFFLARPASWPRMEVDSESPRDVLNPCCVPEKSTRADRGANRSQLFLAFLFFYLPWAKVRGPSFYESFSPRPSSE